MRGEMSSRIQAQQLNPVVPDLILSKTDDLDDSEPSQTGELF